MVNFLALLGWSPGNDRELMTRDELIAAFALDGISGGNAVFDTAKLDWMNGQYLAALSDDHVRALVVPVLADAGVWPPTDDRADDGWLDQLLTLLRPRAKRLTEFAEQARPFLVERVEYDAEDTWVLNLYVLVETNKPGVNNDAQAVTLTYPATTTAWQAMLDVPLEYKRGGGYTFVFSFGEGRTAYLLCNKKDALVLRGLVSGALSMRTVESE